MLKRKFAIFYILIEILCQFHFIFYLPKIEAKETIKDVPPVPPRFTTQYQIGIESEYGNENVNFWYDGIGYRARWDIFRAGDPLIDRTIIYCDGNGKLLNFFLAVGDSDESECTYVQSTTTSFSECGVQFQQYLLTQEIINTTVSGVNVYANYQQQVSCTINNEVESGTCYQYSYFLTGGCHNPSNEEIWIINDFADSDNIDVWIPRTYSINQNPSCGTQQIYYIYSSPEIGSPDPDLIENIGDHLLKYCKDVSQTTETASRSPYPQASESSTLSPYPQVSQSSTLSPYPQVSESSTRSPYPQASESSTLSPYPQVSQSSTLSPYPQVSETASRSPYPETSQSVTPSPYPSPSAYPTLSSSVTPYPSLSQTSFPSISQTPFPSLSPTGTISDSPSISLTPFPTRSPIEPEKSDGRKSSEPDGSKTAHTTEEEKSAKSTPSSTRTPTPSETPFSKSASARLTHISRSSTVSPSSQSQMITVTEVITATVTPTVLPGECYSLLSCHDCTENDDCVWCTYEDNGTCIYGSIFGPSENSEDECENWRWGQCQIKGVWMLTAIFSSVAVGIICLIILILICFCCLRRATKRSKKHQQESQSRLLDEQTPKSNKNKSDAQRDRVRQQYPTSTPTV
eukprot:TRINITY_DN216_c0_g2_i1.p1 TRINITY_DN216_c0_g2~~TRINITY_DN216_c0_g2_i1.p1  ORF type:complete len:629 (+),score=252.53 TRINITY_DN216_c0_g2_i1:50-1936(+)